MAKYETKVFGRLCVEVINATLETELEPGNARMSSKVHEKIATKHAEAYDVCMRHLQHTLDRPTYIGQHPKHTDKLELLRRVEGGAAIVLVAVTLERDNRGDYRVASTYTVSEADVDRWRASGRMRPPARP